MKIINLIMLLVVSSTLAQVKGNKDIVTKNFDLENVNTINVQMYAKVYIDANADSVMSIKADSNLIDLIGKEVVDGKLTLDQIEWIKPSQDIIITIGAPGLQKLIHGTHDITSVANLKQDNFKVETNVGTINLQGSVQNLIVDNKLANIKAGNLIAQNAEVIISGRGKVKLNVTGELDTNLDKNARLELVGQPEKITGNYSKESQPKPITKLVYVNFKLKNNSWNRNHFYVEGPNPDGTSFSYGFPIMPGLTRAERWTVGTKVYLDKKIGKRQLLYTVTAAAEGKTVKLFD